MQTLSNPSTPVNSPAEAALLACVLCAPGECADTVLPKISPEDFYDVRHKMLCAVFKDMHRGGVPIDAVTLHSELAQRGCLEDCGGRAYVLAGLSDQFISAANVQTYLQTVLRVAAQRQTLSAAREIIGQIERYPEQAPSIIKHAARTFTALHETLTHSANTGPTIVDAAEFIAGELDTPPEIVRGILHKGSKLVLGGGSKSFKTWTLLDLAVSQSHGADWLGFSTRKGRVLYVNLEIQDAFFSKRVQQVAEAKSVTLERGQLMLLNLRGHCAQFDTLIPTIEDKAHSQNCDLIVLDPVYKLYGNTDENSAGDVAKLLNAIERLSVNTGAAVAFGAHFSKGNQAGKESIDRISGSGVFARDPDSILILTRHEEENAFTLDCTLRNLPPVEPFVVQWDFPLMHRDESLDPAKLKKPSGRAKTHTEKDLLDLLPKDGAKAGEWEAEAVEQCGMKRATFYALKKSLLQSGRIRLDKISNKWRSV